jgi:hypothetical protein
MPHFSRVLRRAFCIPVFTAVFWLRTTGAFDSQAAITGPLPHSANFSAALSAAASVASKDELGSVISGKSLVKLSDANTVSQFTTLTSTPSGFYVLDTVRQHVTQFDKHGVFRGVFGKKGVGPGAYVWPSGLAPVTDPANSGSQDVWLTDFHQSRVNRLASDGTYRNSFPISAQGFAAKGIAQNPATGDIYICGNKTSASRASVLHHYDRTGKFSESFFDLSGATLALNLDSANDCLFTNAGGSTLVAFPYEYVVYLIENGSARPLVAGPSRAFHQPALPLVFPGPSPLENIHAFEDWSLKCTLIDKIVAIDDATLLVQYETFSPLRYELDVWDLHSKRMLRSVRTNHRLLASAGGGGAYFLEQLETAGQPEYTIIEGKVNAN